MIVNGTLYSLGNTGFRFDMAVLAQVVMSGH